MKAPEKSVPPLSNHLAKTGWRTHEAGSRFGPATGKAAAPGPFSVQRGGLHNLRRTLGQAIATTRFGCMLITGLLLSSCTTLKAGADAQTAGAGNHPNFLLIVADDMAYSDIGAFGGEIDTPNLDRLAQRGARLTDFHVAPSCSPTRAMLLTGNDSHVAGLGGMAEALRPEQRGRPGYEGHLNQSVATIAERLRDAGYFTAMTGKWHLGGAPTQIPAARGFDRSFALMNGAANYYGKDQDGSLAGTLLAASYFEDAQRARLPDGAYTTDYFTTRLIGFLDQNRESENKPFFAYLAFNAPHSPLQAPQPAIRKYHGRYDAGPRALAEQRLKRLEALGVAPPDTRMSPMHDVPQWSSLSAAEKAAAERRMEVYAGAVDVLDRNVGRVLQALKRNGQLENTIVIFLSDNGAEGVDENIWLSFLERLGLPQEAAQAMRAANADLSRVGSSDGYVSYGPGWAQAGMAPFSLTKSFTTEGGIRAPLIVSGPGVAGGRIIHDFAHVTDIVPTMLDIAGVGPTAAIARQGVREPQGASLKTLLAGQKGSALSHARTEGWELFGRRAIRSGPWKAVYMNTPVVKSNGGTGPGQWFLYNLDTDPGETIDRSADQPAILRDILSKWDDYAARNGVIPVPPAGAAPR